APMRLGRPGELILGQDVVDGREIAIGIVRHNGIRGQEGTELASEATASALARERKSRPRRVRPMRSRYSHSGTAYLRVVPRMSRISATVIPTLPARRS